jgi:hypothetical protein
MNIKLIHREGKYLFSHSGVLPTWLETNGLSLDDLENLPLEHPALMQVSPYRGGWNEAGSCVWGDVREYAASEHISDLYQIFGHTQLQKPLITDKWACLDCRKGFIFDTVTHECSSCL